MLTFMPEVATGCPDPAAILEFVSRPASRADIEEHVASCPTCQSWLGALLRTPIASDVARATSLGQGSQLGDREPLASPHDLELVTVDPDHYEITGAIASGGMGRIFAANDRRLGREVVIKELLADTPERRVRFEREARITARLTHPSIVSVIEAGRWPTGEPFYVMKRVAGHSLASALERAGSLAERLALLPSFIAVADALAYAHDRGIIHRDLKPTNVMLGTFGETVVIDWGLAKDLRAIEPDEPCSNPADAPSGLTSDGDVMGTPAYMPPEQATGHPVDARADVYALGAILYHVLAGVPPYEGESAVLVAVTQGPPLPVTRRVPGVPAELASIVAKAMARDRDARYPTAAELARELTTFQTGQLVASHRYTTRQLVRRWLGRHRGAVTVGALAVAVLSTLSVIGVRRITSERRQAVQERVDAERLVDFMVDTLHEKLGAVGKLKVMADAARQVLAYYADRPEDGTEEDLHRRAQALTNIGEVLAPQGDVHGAEAAFTGAIAAWQRLVVRAPGTAAWQEGLANTLRARGGASEAQGQSDAALADYRQSLAVIAAITSPSSPIARRVALGRAHGLVGNILLVRGHLDAALAELREALAVCAAAVADAPDDDDASSGLADLQGTAAEILVAQAAFTDAIKEYRKLIDLRTRLAGRAPDDVKRQQKLAGAYADAGRVEVKQGDFVAALASYRARVAIHERLAARDPANLEWQDDLANAQAAVGQALVARGEAAEALSYYRQALARSTRVTAVDPSNARFQDTVALLHDRIGDVLEFQNATSAALAEFEAGRVIAARLAEHDPSDTNAARGLAIAELKICRVTRNGTQPAELAACRSSVPRFERLATDRSIGRRADVASAHDAYGQALFGHKDFVGALAETKAALAVYTEIQAMEDNQGWQRALLVTHLHAGDALAMLHEREAARGEYDAARALAEGIAAADNDNVAAAIDVARCHFALGDLYFNGDRGRAGAEYRTALAIAERLLAKLPHDPTLVALRDEARGLLAETH